jgi:hypothetical protein
VPHIHAGPQEAHAAARGLPPSNWLVSALEHLRHRRPGGVTQAA